LLSVTVTDVTGRTVETRERIPSNGIVQVGTKLGAGIYFIEVKQGVQKHQLKLIKQ
jgi:hypothetical protein